MALKLTTAPNTYPVTLGEAKLHLRVDVTDDDSLITALIAAAADDAEQYTGRALMAQTWTLTLDEFPKVYELTRTNFHNANAVRIQLTRPPVQSVTAVTYYDTNGSLQTLSSGAYTVDLTNDFDFARIVPVYNTVWPDTLDQINAVEVVFVAGYANAAAVPQLIKTWMLLRIAALYENRAAWTMGRDVINENPAADRLLDKYRIYAA